MNLFTLASYIKFVFSRPDSNGKKLAKGVCLARKMRDKEVFYLVVPRVANISVNPFTGNSAIWRSAILRIINKNIFSQML